MSHRSLLVCVTVSVLVLSSQALSQEPLQRSNESGAAAVRKKAIDLLVTVAGQIDSLHSAENRARIGSNIAGLLWNQDEKRSRSLFAAVQEEIKTGFSDADPDDEAHFRTLGVFWQLRADTINRIAEHDPDLALLFLRATKLPPDPRMRYNPSDLENSMELQLAGQISANNPKLALKLGRQSLAQGLTIELLSFLSQLQRKDNEASQSLYREIVDKLKGTDLAFSPSNSEMALNLAQSFYPPQADEQTYRDFMEFLLTSALAQGCAEAKDDAPQFCYGIGRVFSRIEKYYPLRAAPLKRWAGDTSGLDTGQVSRMDNLSELQRPTSEATLASVQQEVRRLPDNEQRIQFLSDVANRMGGNDRDGALGLLNQAGEMIDSLKPGKKQLEGQIGLATLYCSLKSERGFAIMESLMPRLNALVSAAADLDGFETRYLRDGEWNMSGEGSVGQLLNGLAQNAGYFASMDFDRSVTLASQFERPELRLMAQLKLAQSVLVKTPNPMWMFQPTNRVP